MRKIEGRPIIFCVVFQHMLIAVDGIAQMIMNVIDVEEKRKRVQEQKGVAETRNL